jgi:hypothetical protein
MEYSEQIAQQDNYNRALKRVRKLKGFYVHLTVFIVVNIMILAVNMYYTNSSKSIFRLQNFSTIFFWGIGLVAHGSSVFITQIGFGKEWEEKKIKKIMERKKNNKL